MIIIARAEPQEIAQLLQQAAAILELQRIPRAGEQPMPKEEWEALITRETTAYFDRLDVSDYLRSLRTSGFDPRFCLF